MSAIAYYLEDEGIATTGISLVRENTEALKPPRFLWVSFPLGRPLGLPNDPAFQRRVILAALALLDAESGPVLEDFPEDVPAPETEDAPACPVGFVPRIADDGSWRASLRRELQLLGPWYALSRDRRGRTTVGLSAEPVERLAERLGELLDAGGTDLAAVDWDLQALKFALEDLKAYYQEAITAQPGGLDWREVRRVLWRETVLGEAMLALRGRFGASGDPVLAAFTRALVPRGLADE
ncbi:MAG TPA: hypothetical protein VF210_04680 [Pseudomonadales bacterium]